MKLLLYVREECERVSESFAGEQKKTTKKKLEMFYGTM
jgi:hypothetical protein